MERGDKYFEALHRAAGRVYEHFDLLPKPIRTALANADNPHSPREIYLYWQKTGDILKTIKFIHKKMTSESHTNPTRLIQKLCLKTLGFSLLNKQFDISIRPWYISMVRSIQQVKHQPQHYGANQMAIYLEAWQNDGKPDAESRIRTMSVKSKSHAKSAAALFGSRIADCVRVTILYTGNMPKRRSMETLWLRPEYVDAF